MTAAAELLLLLLLLLMMLLLLLLELVHGWRAGVETYVSAAHQLRQREIDDAQTGNMTAAVALHQSNDHVTDQCSPARLCMSQTDSLLASCVCNKVRL